VAFSDSFGRKPLLYLPSGSDLFQRLALLPTMNMQALALSQVPTLFFSKAGANTALADLFKDEPAEIARFSTLFLLGNVLATIVVPMLGGALAARNLRYPYVASAVFCVANLCLVATMPETLPKSERKPFNVRGVPRAQRTLDLVRR
jgi:MFS family permease